MSFIINIGLFKRLFMAILIFFKKYINKPKNLYIILLLFNLIKIIIRERYPIMIEDKYKNNINKYLTLKNLPINLNDSLIIKEKKSILNLLSECVGRNITSVDSIFLAPDCNFGNGLVILNKILFYCEIINCKKIILDSKIFWYIKNQTIIEKNNITIKVEKKINYDKTSSIYYNFTTPFFTFFYIKPEIRINLIRKEIIRNLNIINVNKDDLYIHVRSGDIFFYPHFPYAQPPFCFYRKILNNHKFNNVYLISQDKFNPVIQKILNEYNSVIYKQNGLKEDISYIINAYNIVASISSFLISILHLNYNLKTLFDYNIYRMSEKIFAYHYDFYQYPNNNFINYRMEPSPYYNKTMFIWKNNKKQRKLMIKEKCINNFRTINISNQKYNLN